MFQIIAGDKVNISGHANVRETEELIRSLLGSYEEHTMTTFSQQFDITRFIDHGQTNRKDLLARFIGLNVIDDLQKSIKEETSSIRTILKEYQQNDYPSILSQYEERLKKTADKIKILNKDRQVLEEDVSKNKKNRDILVNSLHPTYDGLRTITSIEVDINKSNKSIEKLEESWETNQKLKVDMMSRNQYASDGLSKISEKGIFEDRKNIYYDTIERQKKLKSDYDLKNQMVNTYEKQSSILSKHDWFETNETCKKCSFLTGAFAARTQLVEEKNWIEDALAEKERLHEELNKHSDFPEDEKLYEKYQKEVAELRSKLENLEIVFENIKLQLELERNKLTSYKDEEKTYKKNENSIKHNVAVEVKIKNVDGKIADIDIKLRDNNNDHTKETSNLGALSQKIMDLDGNIEVLKEIEKKYALHELLMEAFGNDGIPLMIMNRAVPLINNEIRKILSNVTNFEVFLEVDTEAHDLMIFIDDGTSRRRVELGSGMEKTLTALTIRSALSNISLLPTCNLFVIDEGFGTLDSENINHMNMLLGYLKGKFENVLIISHIESMQDITNNVININKNERGYSSIKIL